MIVDAVVVDAADAAAAICLRCPFDCLICFLYTYAFFLTRSREK